MTSLFSPSLLRALIIDLNSSFSFIGLPISLRSSARKVYIVNLGLPGLVHQQDAKNLDMILLAGALLLILATLLKSPNLCLVEIIETGSTAVRSYRSLFFILIG